MFVCVCGPKCVSKHPCCHRVYSTKQASSNNGYDITVALSHWVIEVYSIEPRERGTLAHFEAVPKCPLNLTEVVMTMIAQRINC